MLCRQKRQAELQRFERSKEQQAEQAVWVAQVRRRLFGHRHERGLVQDVERRQSGGNARVCAGGSRGSFQLALFPRFQLAMFSLPRHRTFPTVRAGACARARAAGA